jgi:alkylation response protein AidB-like acyl-CoA dehydrogenase
MVGESAIQMHGGIGMTDECQASHYYRRLTVLEKRAGDRQHHLYTLADVIAEQRPSLFA